MIEFNQEEQTIQTYDVHAESWARDHPPADYTTILAQLKKLKPQGSVVEIGCGGGQDAEMLVAAGYDYLGTDAAAGMVELAKQKHPKCTFRHLNLYDLGSLKQQFDIFWCNAVLLHIPRRRIDEALEAISAAIQPDGVGFMTLKDGDTEVFEERTVAGRQENRIFTYWRKDEFIEVLKRNNFEVVYYGYDPVSERSQWHQFVVRKMQIA